MVRNWYVGRGHQIKGKSKANCYFFIEFQDEISVQKTMRYLKKMNPFNATGYLVGTNTFVHLRRSKRGTASNVEGGRKANKASRRGGFDSIRGGGRGRGRVR